MTTTTKRPDGGELKPCPFCGGEAKDNGHPLGIMGQIYCPNDDCFGPKTTAGLKEDSIKQWNTRTPTNESPAPQAVAAYAYEWALTRDAGKYDNWTSQISFRDPRLDDVDQLAVRNVRPLYPAPQADEALHHLGMALAFGAVIHPDDRNAAYENALAFYNRMRPDLQIDAQEHATLRTHDPAIPAPQATKKTYIKPLRTIVEIDARYADQIRDLLNAPAPPPTNESPAPQAEASEHAPWSEDEEDAERLLACASRRKKYGDENCECDEDGSCIECEYDMQDALKKRYAPPKHTIAPAPQPPVEGLVPVYVKKWRTLIMVPPSIRDEINADIAALASPSLTAGCDHPWASQDELGRPYCAGCGVPWKKEFGCPVCNGDCASANPRQIFCPMKSAAPATLIEQSGQKETPLARMDR